MVTEYKQSERIAAFNCENSDKVIKLNGKTYVTAITKNIKEVGVLEELECLIEFDALTTRTAIDENRMLNETSLFKPKGFQKMDINLRNLII